MCGFSGIAFSNSKTKDKFPEGISCFRAAAIRVTHRGNTDHQEWIRNNIWLSHYRLAFQDITGGIQPMLSNDGGHIIVFNGEVYNHLELRKLIDKQTAYDFKTRSDTETLLAGWLAFGEAFFDELEGEYAFVIMDVAGTKLVAHRDHFGVKPLVFYINEFNTRKFSDYAANYTFTTNRLEFSSEIKGLASNKSWNRDGLIRQYVGLYEPICTPFENVIQIPPGGVLLANLESGSKFKCSLNTLKSPVRHAPRGHQVALEEEFEEVFYQAVSERLLSDVELGVYLSGGVDSKAVAFELARATKGAQALKSFTIGFAQSGYDETEEALRFSSHIGFDPHVIKVDNEALNYSYPFAVQTSELVQPYTNGSAKWWLSLFARRYVKGVLTGDGADEIFCGYPSYRYTNWWKHTMRSRGKATTDKEVMSLLASAPFGTRARDGLYSARFASDTKNPWLSGSSAAGNGHDFIDSIRLLGVPHPLFGQIYTITCALLGIEEGENWLKKQSMSIQSWFGAGLDNLSDSLCDPEYALLLWQNYFAKTHLPVLILNWVGDRMEMANTLEGRTPFLSKKVYNFLSHQPDRALVHGLRDKVLLRKTYARLFPAKFATTPKKQFNAPFINSEALVKKYNTEQIFEVTGLANNDVLQNIQKQAFQNDAQNSYYATHLRSAYQTAISLSIVHDCLINNHYADRDELFEESYFKTAGHEK